MDTWSWLAVSHKKVSRVCFVAVEQRAHLSNRSELTLCVLPGWQMNVNVNVNYEFILFLAYAQSASHPALRSP